MSDYIGETHPKARKAHRCGLCYYPIPKGMADAAIAGAREALARYDNNIDKYISADVLRNLLVVLAGTVALTTTEAFRHCVGCGNVVLPTDGRCLHCYPASPAPAPTTPAPVASEEMRAAAERLCDLTLEACRGEGCEDPEHEAAWALRRILSPASDAPEESSAPAPKDPDEDDIPY